MRATLMHVSKFIAVLAQIRMAGSIGYLIHLPNFRRKQMCWSWVQALGHYGQQLQVGFPPVGQLR